MPEHLPKKPRLLIVSDTSMWMLDNKMIAFEPVVREIEHFYTLFDQITWIGYQRDNRWVDANTRKIAAFVPIKFVPLKAVGGTALLDKLKILLVAPYYALVVWRHILDAEVVHTRAPSLPAFWAICFSFLDRTRIYWHKYAGNWQEPNPPIFYGLQRSLLKKVKHTSVTINGKWENQQRHLLSFENPCLTDAEYQEAKAIASDKQFNGLLILAFVGNLTSKKGIIELMKAIPLMKNQNALDRIIIAGDGILRADVENMARTSPIKIEILGYLNREQLKTVYANAHVICLPSYSEGFPKVIAEGGSFGCIPVVSDISAIGQYIFHKENGFLLEQIDSPYLARVLDDLIDNRTTLKDISLKAMRMSHLFTYERFISRLAQEILKYQSV